MKKLISLALTGLIASFSIAQTTDLGGPLSWKGKLDTHISPPVENMPGYDQQQVDYEDSINDILKEGPWRFGYKYDTDITLDGNGLWTDLPNGDKLWRVGIKCDGAMTINLIFEDLFIPEGAYLYMSDIDQTNRVGAYTSRNNRADGILGTELVHGDEIIVEYYEPAEVEGQGHFTIANVVHGYRSLNIIQDELWKALNSSGDCNIDVGCPLGVGWEDQIRSVAMIVVSGSGICSGALINNTCDDGTPYFLTANHCLGGESSWAFRFNWDSPSGNLSCADTNPSADPGPPYDQTANGATLLANSGQSDFALLLIDNMTLTDATTWNCFYAGWDNSDALTVTQATGIHHPSGDVKKICREDDAPYHNTAAGAEVWWIDSWDQGVTEPGSSGSPLFDQNGRIIGQLYGGAAACSGTSNNGQYDYYGRFGVSWGLGVDTYLGAGACGTATTNDGFDPNSPTMPDDAGIQTINVPTGTFCGSDFDGEVILRNFGTNNLTSVTINYDIDAGTNNTFNWTGNLAPGATEVVNLPTLATASGAHTFNCYTTLPNGNADSNASNDGSSSNYTAVVGGMPITLDLNVDCWGSEVTWEIQDGGGATLYSGGPYTDNPAGESFTYNFCLAPACYDFIINDSYGDGMYGTQWGCPVDGDYTITDDNSGTTLATIQAANSDYGNQEINNFCVTNPCTWTLSYTTTEENCFGDNTGSIDITVTGGTGPFTYDIGSGPQGSNVFTNQAQGNYTVTVDDGACTSSIAVTLSGPAQIDMSTTTVTDVSCNGDSDGQIDVGVTGGTGTMQYSIDGGSTYQSGSNFSGLSPGNYSIDVLDANGCPSTQSFVVGEPTALGGSVVVSDEYMGNDGAIDLTVTGGTGPFTYSWNTGATTEDLTGLAGGNYSVTITDAQGCTHTITNIIVASYVGLDENCQIQFSLYPNPSQGVFNVFIHGEPSNNTTVTILDVTGRIVYQNDVSGESNFVVDITDKANGTYILRINTGDKQSQMTIINNK